MLESQIRPCNTTLSKRPNLHLGTAAQARPAWIWLLVIIIEVSRAEGFASARFPSSWLEVDWHPGSGSPKGYTEAWFSISRPKYSDIPQGPLPQPSLFALTRLIRTFSVAAAAAAAEQSHANPSKPAQAGRQARASATYSKARHPICSRCNVRKGVVGSHEHPPCKAVSLASRCSSTFSLFNTLNLYNSFIIL